jgi:hypothetical protein
MKKSLCVLFIALLVCTIGMGVSQGYAAANNMLFYCHQCTCDLCSFVNQSCRCFGTEYDTNCYQYCCWDGCNL